MSIISAIILGIVQGLTEFFPVSSSTHLWLAKSLLHVPSDSVMLDLSCHFGTLLALCWALRREITSLLKTPKSWPPFAMALLPLIPAYLLLSPLRQTPPSYVFLSITLASTACFLFLGETLRIRQPASIPEASSWKHALWIGASQALALVPGISRSASSLSCARILGFSRTQAVSFSFLLSIPTIVGGLLLEIIHLWEKGEMGLWLQTDSVIAFLVSLGTGLCTVNVALKILREKRSFVFTIYCFILASSFLIYTFLGVNWGGL